MGEAAAASSHEPTPYTRTSVQKDSIASTPEDVRYRQVKGQIKEFKSNSPKEQQFISGGLNQYNDAIDEAIYGSDEFRMYAYKIKRCTRMRSHDWTECPYAHRGEKAQRRDPRKVPYSAIACPAFRNGRCQKGDACEFAHGVFEYWLHPARYRTRACNAGRFCQRKVCFFAHTPDQLRSESKYKCHFAYKGRMTSGGDQLMAAGSGGGEGSNSTSMQAYELSPFSSMENNRESCSFEGVSDFLKNLRALKIREDEERERNIGGGFELSDSDLPHLDWISELVK